MYRTFLFILCFIVNGGISATAQQNTKVVVRAKAKNAKFIGDKMDGAAITILKSSTGDTLAHGITRGGTGNTKRLVKDPIQRYEKISGSGDAKFQARLTIREPTLVTIKATVNRNKPLAEATTSVQQWIIPGHHITGDGIILEVPGFVVTNRAPKEEKTYAVGDSILIKTHVILQCGCPTAAGGLWDSSDYDMEAQISRNGKNIETIPMQFTGETSLFKASFVPDSVGLYHVLTYVFNAKTENTGVAKTKITVRR